MKEKKNIDRLFQEKFKNFEAHPSESVWNNIAAAQKKKDDRKIIPIWWKLGGVAAGLAILMGLATLYLNDSSSDTVSPIVMEDNVDTKSSDKPSLQEATPLIDSKDSPTLSFENKDKDNNTSNDELEINGESEIVTNDATPSSDKTAIGTSQTSEAEKNQNESVIKKSQINRNLGVANNKVDEKDNFKNINLDQDKPNSIDKPETRIATTASGNDKVSDVQNPEDEVGITEEKDLIAEAEKITSAQNETVVLPDDLAKKNRWDVGAVAAPVYYGNFGGSGLDPSFKDNSKTGEVNLSYGVQVSYAVTPKLKVRSGVSNVDLSYNTNDLAFSINSTSRTPIMGVNFSQNGNRVTISDNIPSELQAPPSLLPGPQTEFNTGSVQQQLNYIEVPVEAVYTISEKRLGISVIGGISTLILNNDEVILVSDDLNTSLGTSNAVNEVSFTTNLGVGLDYKITDEFKFNVEPAFKYQINGFDDSVGEFKPYYLGVYTGFSYKF